jgi:hypothetical protein
LEQEELVAAEARPGMLAAVVKLVVPVQHLHVPLAVPPYVQQLMLQVAQEESAALLAVPANSLSFLFYPKIIL